MESKELEGVWSEHVEREFGSKDAEAALATMVDDAYVTCMPVGSGGRGKEQLRTFYRDIFIPSWPDDLQIEPVNRVVGDGQLVDELHLSFTHAKRMEWLLPGLPPTNQRVDMDFVVVVQFRGELIAGERVYWDQAAVLRQVGLL
jgi:carboxymethylenebutenolidase